MRKPELAAAIAEKADLSKEQANRALNAILDEITQALSRKDTVTLVGFGTFMQRHRGARTGKNPQTGEPVKIKASNTVAFKPGKGLKDSVNGSTGRGSSAPGLQTLRSEPSWNSLTSLRSASRASSTLSTARSACSGVSPRRSNNACGLSITGPLP